VIVIDSMLERIRHEKTLDVYGHVTCLRSQRNYMVQTEDQYVFMHDALVEAIQSGVTEVPARSLYAHLQRLSGIDASYSCTGIELEFKVRAAQQSFTVAPALVGVAGNFDWGFPDLHCRGLTYIHTCRSYVHTPRKLARHVVESPTGTFIVLHALANSSDFWLLGEQSFPKWDIPCPGRR